MMVYAQQVTENAVAAFGGSEVLIIISIVVNVAVFAFGYGKLSNEVKNLKDVVKNVKEDVGKRIDKQGEKIDRVAEGLAELRGAFVMLKEAIATQRSSPITLTKRGEEIFRDSGGDAMLEELFDELYPRFEGITNAYDIQRKAEQIVEDLFDEGEKLERVKDYLYDGEVGFKTVVEVLGIELRDRVFERRGMPVKKRAEEPEPSVVRDAARKV